MRDKLDSQLLPARVEDSINEDGIDLRQYFYVITKYKWGILSFIIVVGLFTTILAYSLQPIYRSTATLLIGGNEPLMGSEPENNARQLARDQFFGTQIELLKSREIATAALARIKLEKNTWFDLSKRKNIFNIDWGDWVNASWLQAGGKETEPVDEADPYRELLVWLRDNLQVKPVEDTSMVKVTFETHNPKMAALVANAVAQAYVETNLEHRIKSSKVASDWLKEQLEKSQKNINKAVENLQKYRENAGLININGEQSIYSEQLRIVIDQLGEAQEVRAKAYNLYRRAEALKNAGQMDVLPAVFNNPWIQQLKRERQELERRIELEKERFKGNYPGRDEIEKTIETLSTQIEIALNQSVDGLKTDYEVALSTERQLQAKQIDLENKVQETNRKKFQADALEQIVLTNRQSYDAYMSQFMKTRTKRSDTITMIARLVDPAIPEIIPVWPKKTLMIAMSIVLAGVVGTGLAFVREGSIFHNKLKTREDVENRLGLSLLGELTLLPKRRHNGLARAPFTEFLNEPKSVFAESIRSIRAAIVLSRNDQSSQVILVTSTVSEEGKTIVAMNLALALSQLGNVLLIDADLRRPSLASLCNIKPKSPGLVDLVEGTGKIAECIARINGDIHLLPAGSSLPLDAMRILASSHFNDLLSVLSQAYDSIVIDSSPVDMVSDVKLMASKASGVVYVIKADSTPHQAISQGLKSLSKVNAIVLGAVLNKVDPKKARSYGKFKYGYYRTFDHYGQPLNDG